MADAKPSGGGFEWGTFEIILGIILVIGLLDTLTGRGVLNNPVSTTTKSTATTKLAKTPCGLTIFSPRTNESVSTFFILNGKTEKCLWTSTPDTALYAQVVDAKGKPVSEYLKVPPVIYDENISATFNSTISINATPTKGTGYVILIPAEQNDTNPTTYRIPIIFK